MLWATRSRPRSRSWSCRSSRRRRNEVSQAHPVCRLPTKRHTECAYYFDEGSVADQGTPDRLPPLSREAECSVLGSMLRENSVIDDVVQIIREEHFYTDAHQKIFRGISTLHDKQPAGRSCHPGRMAEGAEAHRGHRRLRLPGRAVGRRPHRRQRRVLCPHRPRQGPGSPADPRHHRDPAGCLRSGHARRRDAGPGRAHRFSRSPRWVSSASISR